MPSPYDVLETAFILAASAGEQPLVTDHTMLRSIRFVVECQSNQSGRRFLMACCLAKLLSPNIDIRKPYTEIGTQDAYSGRDIDQTYILSFATSHRLPVNVTTAFLTPAYRNRDAALTPDVTVVGRPKQLYVEILQLLDHVYRGRLAPQDLLAEVMRQLIEMRMARDARMAMLLAAVEPEAGALPLSSEGIVELLDQHLRSSKASRLPVLIVTAAYQAASNALQEAPLPLYAHNAADSQTRSLGDIQIVLTNDSQVVSAYEMKDKEVRLDDVEIALAKVLSNEARPDNYILITTKPILKEVTDYAASLYAQTGTEFAVLDCIGFIRHFLHLFHRLRLKFLNTYQTLVLAEPESAVGQPLKEVFLSLRQLAEFNLNQAQDQHAHQDTLGLEG